ncbi:MAG: NUDIX domain-containing protein [Candidatus Paceibacterota bacterium]
MNNLEEILEFGIKREGEERRDGGCAIVFHPETQRYAVFRDLKNGLMGLFGGGFNEGENEQDGVIRELIEESGLIDFLYVERIEKIKTHYFNSNKKINRVALATCFLVILKSTNSQLPKLEEHEKIELVWTTPSEILSHWKSRNHNKDYDHWIYLLGKGVSRLKELGHDRESILE